VVFPVSVCVRRVPGGGVVDLRRPLLIEAHVLSRELRLAVVHHVQPLGVDGELRFAHVNTVRPCSDGAARPLS